MRTCYLNDFLRLLSCVNECHLPCPSELYSALAMHWSAISACGLRSCKQLGLIIRHIATKQVRPVDVKPVQEVLNGVWDALWYVPLLIQLHHRHRHLRHCVQVASSSREEFLRIHILHLFFFVSQPGCYLIMLMASENCSRSCSFPCLPSYFTISLEGRSW